MQDDYSFWYPYHDEAKQAVNKFKSDGFKPNNNAEIAYKIIKEFHRILDEKYGREARIGFFKSMVSKNKSTI